MRARRVIPGTTYHIVRRTVGQQFLLTPDRTVNAIFEYALVSAVTKHRMLLHGWVLMSNHSHVVITDVHGVLPDFVRDFHRAVAMAVKDYRGLAECVWSDAPTTAVELHGERAQLDAVRYGVMNPVEACLVENSADWPGAQWLPGRCELVAKRPEVWFSDKQAEVVRAVVVPPPAWSHSEEAWHARVNELVQDAEQKLLRERIRARRPVMGRRRVLDQKPTASPEAKAEEGRTTHPALATGGDGKLFKKLMAELRAWRLAYLEARERWRRDKGATFPFGTWWKVVYDGAAMAA